MAVTTPNPQPDLSAAAVRRAVAEVMGWEATTFDVERIDRGYSWVTLAVGDVIVRVAPLGGTLEPYDPEVEAAALRRVAGVVPAPRLLAVQPDPDNPIGRPFGVHTRAPGEVLHLAEVTEQRSGYVEAMADALTALHTLQADVTVSEAYNTELARTADIYERVAPRRYPEFEQALRWLREHRPDCDDPAVWCHGDFRFANMSWTGPGELGAVLDWERAWAGDPMCDVAFTRRFSGWCAVWDYGHPLDEPRIAYAERFEQVRSYTASMRGMRAYLEGRNSNERLLRIGQRGEHGIRTELTWATKHR